MVKRLLIGSLLFAAVPAAAFAFECGEPTGPVPVWTGCTAYYWQEKIADFPGGGVMDVLLQVPQDGEEVFLEAFSFSYGPDNELVYPSTPASFRVEINGAAIAWSDIDGPWGYHNLRDQPLPVGDVSLKVFATGEEDVWADLRFGEPGIVLEAVPTPGSLAGMLGGFGVLAALQYGRQRAERGRAQSD